MAFVKTPPRRLSPDARKYQRGDRITSLADFTAAIDAHEWVFVFADKALHPSVASAQQVTTIRRAIAQGRAYRAKRNTWSPFVFRAWCQDGDWIAICGEIYQGTAKARKLTTLVKKCRALLPNATARMELVLIDPQP